MGYFLSLVIYVMCLIKFIVRTYSAFFVVVQIFFLLEYKKNLYNTTQHV